MRKAGIPQPPIRGPRQPIMKDAISISEFKKSLIKYINIPYIRTYYESCVNYDFSTLEAAYLIRHAQGLTLQERFDAWAELMDTLSDEVMPPLAAVTGKRTVFEFLKAYMRSINEDIKEFCRFDPEYVYTTSASCCVFTSFEKAMEFEKDRKKDELMIYKMKPDKRPIGQLVFDRENRLINTHTYDSDTESYRESFWNMWFDFPTAYKPGDLIWLAGMKESMFVVKGKPILTKEEKDEYTKLGCNSDMCLEGWLVYPDEEIGDEITTSYYHLDYSPYTNKLTAVEEARVSEIQKRLRS